MKKNTLIIILSIILIASLVANYYSFIVINYNNDLTEDAVRSKTSNLFYADKTSHKFQKMSGDIEKLKEFNGHKYDSLNQLIIQTHISLQNLSEKLMEITGGRDISARFIESDGKRVVSTYFFGHSDQKGQGQIKIDKLVTHYLNQYFTVTGEESEILELYRIYGLDLNRSLAKMFEGMTMPEAQYIIEAIRNRIEVDRYKFLMTELAVQ